MTDKQDLSDKESAGLRGVNVEGMLVTSAQLSLLVTRMPPITKLHLRFVDSSFPSVFE